MRFYLLVISIISISACAQQSDILLLQKNNRSIRQFFPGTTINFFTTDGMSVSASIDHIRRDSLFLRQYDVRMVPNIFGTFSPDTVAVYDLNFSVKNIGSFPAAPQKFPLFTSGALFMAGGATYLLLNTVNTLREGDPLFGKDNLPNVFSGLAVAATGVLMNQTQVKRYHLGRKYKLKYLPAAGI